MAKAVEAVKALVVEEGVAALISNIYHLYPAKQHFIKEKTKN